MKKELHKFTVVGPTLAEACFQALQEQLAADLSVVDRRTAVGKEAQELQRKVDEAKQAFRELSKKLWEELWEEES